MASFTPTDPTVKVENCVSKLSNLKVEENGQGLSLGEFIQNYAAKQEAEFALLCKQKADARREAELSTRQVTRFNYDDVPDEIKEHTWSLPIHSRKDELIELIKNNQIVIVMGETGSGKSTQIPQFLVEAGCCDNERGIIGVTQPRRVAAKSLAERVAKEGGVELGTLVGYMVRFDKCVSGQTLVKYMTDGMLLMECAKNHNLMGYSVIMVDEAHERRVDTDVCFGWLKKVARNRPDLRVIISSATLNEEKFSSYFNNAPVFKVLGRNHPVEIVHWPSQIKGRVIEAVVGVILQLLSETDNGDILAFLSGQGEIEEIAECLEDEEWNTKNPSRKKLLVLPCYGALPFEDQQKIFEKTPDTHRKVVLATNIAETSITIENIVYVIDSGYRKVKRHDPRTKIDTLYAKLITQFQAIQRAGRAGRTMPGKCIRLYTNADYNGFDEYPEPDIYGSNVESVMLKLLAMGVTQPHLFDYMDPPNQEAMELALENLKELGAVNHDGTLTPLGDKMSSFPVDPPLARVLIESNELGCSTEVITICSMLSAQYQNLFYKGKKVRTKAQQKKATFNQAEGDYHTLLKIYECWKANDYSKDWCWNNYIQYRVLEEAEEIRMQLKGIYLSHNYHLSRPASNNYTVRRNIQKAFTSGYFRQAVVKNRFGFAYNAFSVRAGGTQEVFIDRSSALYGQKPEWIIFHEVVTTSKAYMREVIKIQPEWIRYYSPIYADKLRRFYNIQI